MRSPQALIAELNAEAARHEDAVLVIGFENTCVCIEADDPGGLKLLKDAVKLGGIPVGLVIADEDKDGNLIVTQRVFPEHADNDDLAEYLLEVAGDIEELAAEMDDEEEDE